MASAKEINPWLSQRSRTVINQRLLRGDTQEYRYKAPQKLKGREKAKWTRWFNRNFPKVQPL